MHTIAFAVTNDSQYISLVCIFSSEKKIYQLKIVNLFLDSFLNQQDAFYTKKDKCEEYPYKSVSQGMKLLSAENKGVSKVRAIAFKNVWGMTGKF